MIPQFCYLQYAESCIQKYLFVGFERDLLNSSDNSNPSLHLRKEIFGKQKRIYKSIKKERIFKSMRSISEIDRAPPVTRCVKSLTHSSALSKISRYI